MLYDFTRYCIVANLHAIVLYSVVATVRSSDNKFTSLRMIA